MTKGVESEEEEEQESPALEKRWEERMEELERRMDLLESDGDDVFLPIPSPIHRLPRPKENWEEKTDENWDMAAEYSELKRDEKQEKLQDGGPRAEEDEENHDAMSVNSERPLPGVTVVDPVLQRQPFSFLTSTQSVDQLWDTESDSGDSQSDASLSAASISGLSVAAGALPGPWVVPGQQRLIQFVDEQMAGQEEDGTGGKKKRGLLTVNWD